jgi:hypothetical protein
MEFVKYFCRLVTTHELDNSDVAEYYDIVQSVVPTKLVTAVSDDGDSISAQVIVYEGENDYFVYEIILQEQVNLDEGETISDTLMQEVEYDFEFETSLEI